MEGLPSLLPLLPFLFLTPAPLLLILLPPRNARVRVREGGARGDGGWLQQGETHKLTFLQPLLEAETQTEGPRPR